MKEAFLVFFGSGLGGLCRYGLSKWIEQLYNQAFPLSTMLVNILACFILGFVVGISKNHFPNSVFSNLFLLAGFCGGFSTFSTFTKDALVLFQQDQILYFSLYIGLSVFLCLLATFGAFYLGEKI